MFEQRPATHGEDLSVSGSIQTDPLRGAEMLLDLWIAATLGAGYAQVVLRCGLFLLVENCVCFIKMYL